MPPRTDLEYVAAYKPRWQTEWLTTETHTTGFPTYTIKEAEPACSTYQYVTKDELKQILKDFAELIETRTHVIINQDEIDELINNR